MCKTKHSWFSSPLVKLSPSSRTSHHPVVKHWLWLWKYFTLIIRKYFIISPPSSSSFFLIIFQTFLWTSLTSPWMTGVVWIMICFFHRPEITLKADCDYRRAEHTHYRLQTTQTCSSLLQPLFSKLGKCSYCTQQSPLDKVWVDFDKGLLSGVALFLFVPCWNVCLWWLLSCLLITACKAHSAQSAPGHAIVHIPEDCKNSPKYLMTPVKLIISSLLQSVSWSELCEMSQYKMLLECCGGSLVWCDSSYNIFRSPDNQTMNTGEHWESVTDTVEEHCQPGHHPHLPPVSPVSFYSICSAAPTHYLHI